MVATRCPAFSNATAMCIATVDFPDPPFSLPRTTQKAERARTLPSTDMALLTEATSAGPRLRSSLPRVLHRLTINLNHVAKIKIRRQKTSATTGAAQACAASRLGFARPQQARDCGAGADHGRAARRPSGAGSPGAAPGRPRGGIDFRQSSPVRTERRLWQLPTNLGRRC